MDSLTFNFQRSCETFFTEKELLRNVEFHPDLKKYKKRYEEIYKSMWILRISELDFELETINYEEIQLLEATKKFFMNIKYIVSKLLEKENGFSLLCRHLPAINKIYYNFKIILTCIKFHYYGSDSNYTLKRFFTIHEFDNFYLTLSKEFTQRSLLSDRLNSMNMYRENIEDSWIKLKNESFNYNLPKEKNSNSDNTILFFWHQILIDIISVYKESAERSLYIINLLCINKNHWTVEVLKSLSKKYTNILTEVKNKNKIDLVNELDKGDIYCDYQRFSDYHLNVDCCCYNPIWSIYEDIYANVRMTIDVVRFCLEKSF
jgi:hypothetical protein